MGCLFLGDAEDSCGSRRGGGDVWALYVQALDRHSSALLVGFGPLDTLRGGLESGLDSFRLVHWSKRAFWIRGMALRGKSWVSLLGCIDGADGSLYFLFVCFLRCGALLHGTRIG
jgi:hypothetical protein